MKHLIAIILIGLGGFTWFKFFQVIEPLWLSVVSAAYILYPIVFFLIGKINNA